MNINGDEFAFLNMNKTMYMSARPALTRATEEAERVHQPHGITISTTPNNLDDYNGAYCYSMIQKAYKFNDKLYDMTREEVLDLLDKNSQNNYIYIEYHYYELGRDEKWYKAQVKALEGDMAKVKREILIEWIFASNQSIFTEEQLDAMSHYVKKDPIDKIVIDGYEINIYEPFNNLMYKNWALSCDIGGGLGKDYSAFSLIDPKSYKMVMNFKNNMIPVLEYAKLVINFVKTYVPNAIIIPERNNSGTVFIEAIQKSEVARNMYYTSSNDKDYTIKTIKHKPLFRKPFLANTKDEKIIYGFNTTATTRKVMTEELLFMIANTRPELVNNNLLFDELRKLIRERSGKINHTSTEHDDLLMSYLIGLFVLSYSNNRNKFFKDISDDPVTYDSVKKVDKTFQKFKEFMSYNNKETMNNKILQNNIDPELLEMQRLIDQKNKKPINNKANRITSIFKMNGE